MISEEKRDPLVEALTERTADAILRERQVAQENLELKEQIAAMRAKIRYLEELRDILFLRCADGGQAGVTGGAEVNKCVRQDSCLWAQEPGQTR